jgi:hypothetical protein
MRFAPSIRAPLPSSVLVVLVVACAAACAAMDPELTAARDSWRGATYDQVVAAWGPPARNAGDSYSWLSESQAQRSGGAGGAIFSDACERTLVIREARVVRAGDWNGASESCKRFGRPRR